MYICENCSKVYVRKDHYESHLNRKTDCMKGLNGGKGVRLECPHCHKGYSRIDSLNRHIKLSCLAKRQISEIVDKNDELKHTISEQHEMIQNLTKMLEKAISKAGNRTMNQNNFQQNTVNQNNIYNQNIYIKEYGKEDLSYITKENMKKVLQHPSKSLEEFTKLVHFHSDHPENINVMLFNKRTKQIMVFQDGKWNLKNCDKFIDGFVGDKFDQLYDILEIHKNEINDDKIELFEKFADKFGKLDSKEREHATESVQNVIQTESNYYGGHYHKTKKQIQQEILENTGKLIPTRNIIKDKRPDDDNIGYLLCHPCELNINQNSNEIEILEKIKKQSLPNNQYIIKDI